MFRNMCCLLVLSAVVCGSPTVDLLPSIDPQPERTLTTLDRELIEPKRNFNINPFLSNYLLHSLAQESEQKRRFQRIRDLNDLMNYRYAIVNKRD